VTAPPRSRATLRSHTSRSHHIEAIALSSTRRRSLRCGPR
jgi:hypothetical protein